MSSRRRLAFSLPLLGLALGLVVLGACKNDEDRPPEGTGGYTPVGPGGSTEAGAQTDSGGASDTGLDSADASACTSLTLMGILVDGDAVIGDPPADTGGTIVNGTYTLTTYQTYVGTSSTTIGPTGITKKATIRIAGGVSFEQIVGTTTQTTTEVDTSLAGSFSAAAPTFSIIATCGTSGFGSFGFTATDSTLRLTNLSTKEAFTYTLM